MHEDSAQLESVKITDFGLAADLIEGCHHITPTSDGTRYCTLPQKTSKVLGGGFLLYTPGYITSPEQCTDVLFLNVSLVSNCIPPPPMCC